MQFLKSKKVLIFSIIIFTLSLMLGTVLAHEVRDFGEYELVFGWRSEPAVVGYPNGPELFILSDEEGALDGMEISMAVEVTFGPATITLNMRQDFRDPTHFIADLIPTRPGDYSFRVFGTIGDMEIDEVFTSADGSFSSVEPAGDITFPDELPSIVDLLERIEELEAQIEALQNE